MKIKNALDFAVEQLSASDSALADARLLLGHVLDVDHSYFAAHGEERLPTAPLESFLTLVARAEQREPIPYIIGRTPFHHVNLAVTPDVLIPRPETEQLVESVIAWATTHDVSRAVDVGTGSGCIAISLAHSLPTLQVIATDISEAALEVARQNALENDTLVLFRQGSLLDPIVEQVDLIVANLPYVTDAEYAQLQDSVRRFEPASALKGGRDGLDLVRQLLRQAQTKLKPVGAIFLEIGWQQGADMRALAGELFPDARVDCLRDYAGHERIVQILLGDSLCTPRV